MECLSSELSDGRKQTGITLIRSISRAFVWMLTRAHKHRTSVAKMLKRNEKKMRKFWSGFFSLLMLWIGLDWNGMLKWERDLDTSTQTERHTHTQFNVWKNLFQLNSVEELQLNLVSSATINQIALICFFFHPTGKMLFTTAVMCIWKTVN